MKRKNLTKKQLEVLKEGWRQLQIDYLSFLGLMYATEKWMSRKTGIKGLEFFMADNGYIGIGNADRSIKLVQREELENER